MKTFKDLSPTPEMQSSYDAAYEVGLNGDDLPPRIADYENTKEGAAEHLAFIWGYAAGLNEHYRRKGIRTSFFSD